MRVFLTGASGFVGSHVLRALLDARHEVLALVVPDDSLWRVRDLSGRFSVVSGTLGDIAALRGSLAASRPEACIHLAWYAEPGKYLHDPQNISSLVGSLELMQELVRVGCKQIVGAGTCAEYDTEFGYLHEDTPTRPATLYAAAKLASCLLGQRIAAQAKIKFAWGRIFYPYGPQEDERRLVPAVIHALQQGHLFPATSGEQVRDYIHVEDVAAGFCVLVEKQADGIFNISSGVPVTIRHLLETIGNFMGRAELVQFGAEPSRSWEPPFICGDNRRLKALGWQPRYAFDQGLLQTIQWWNGHASGSSAGGCH